MMNPEWRGTHPSKRFKLLINACIPLKNNGGEKQVHSDFHYTCSQINIVNEMAILCSTGAVRLSVDNKNKINVGTLADDRRCKINIFRLVHDSLNYNDHDFPFKN